jgi:glycosyltransferase involved in cell wall biosynthesis
MSKVKCVVSCPIDCYSGYSGRSRDFVRALIESQPDWDIKILSQRWGNTRKGYLEDHQDTLFTPLIINKLEQKPDVWIQITVPNEFQQIGTYNIGVTAGIETTLCDPSWIQGCNRMNLVLISSKHAKETLQRSVFQVKDERTGQPAGELRLTTPVEVLFEGVDTNIYKKLDKVQLDLSEIKESFCYLVVGHWMQGSFGHDRKNIGYTVKAFLETFKNKENPPALLLKTQQATASILDRESILTKIDAIRKTVKGRLPNVYLLHGDLTDQEINELYNHPKVKVLLTLTKGEGFGRPILEFASIGKPVIATNWSGQIDFLNPEFSTMVDGTLENVHESAYVPNVLLKESQWFKPEDGQVGMSLRKTFEKYKDVSILGKRQSFHVLTSFKYEHMRDLMQQIMTRYIPEFPKQIQLKLPQLKKIELPKLQKL